MSRKRASAKFNGLVSVGVLASVVSCGSPAKYTGPMDSGTAGIGGGSSAAAGSPGLGGRTGSGGMTVATSGGGGTGEGSGTSTGGTMETGMGGSSGMSGTAGQTSAVGGTSSGGTVTGGTATGGKGTGGTGTGGMGTGGMGTGGATGGKGGTSTGSGSGGSAPACPSPEVQLCGGAMCCNPAPANAFISCTSSTPCLAQCNTGYHACNGQVSPCYSDGDVQHCGDGCLDCRQANATAVCGALTSAQCANTCLGTTLACPGASVKPTCGSWDFESGTTEGWTNSSNKYNPDASAGQFGVSSAQHSSGTQALFIGHTNPGATPDAFSLTRIQLCPLGSVDLSSKILSVSVYADPAPGTSTADLNLENNCEMFLWTYPSGGGYLNPENGTQTLKMRTWTRMDASLGTGPSAVLTGLELQFRTYNTPWVGTVYFDDIRLVQSP